MTKKKESRKTPKDHLVLAKIISDTIEKHAARHVAEAIVSHVADLLQEGLNIHLEIRGRGKERKLVIEATIEGVCIASESLRYLLVEDELIFSDESPKDDHFAAKELHTLASDFEESRKVHWGEEWKP